MMTAFAVQLPHVDEPDSDLHLARRCAAGDADAFESIYHAHADRMKSIAYHHLGNVADAEDAVQETYLRDFSQGRHTPRSRRGKHRRRIRDGRHSLTRPATRPRDSYPIDART